MDVLELKETARRLRIDAVNAVYHAGSGHLGGSLSCMDILTALYFYKMRIDPENPDWADRDRLVVSKGHAAPAVFAALARKGYFPPEELEHLRKPDSFLQGAVSISAPGVDFSTGPLGMGLSAAVGMALGGRYQKKEYKTYCILGDGECQEGEVWEAAMSAAHFRLGNLAAVLDHNGLQQGGTNDQVMSLGNISEKMRAFGWNVMTVNGHDMEELIDTFDHIPFAQEGQPTFVIAETVKGKGISFMEGNYKWHAGAPDDTEYAMALKELGGD